MIGKAKNHVTIEICRFSYSWVQRYLVLEKFVFLIKVYLHVKNYFMYSFRQRVVCGFWVVYVEDSRVFKILISEVVISVASNGSWVVVSVVFKLLLLWFFCRSVLYNHLLFVYIPRLCLQNAIVVDINRFTAVAKIKSIIYVWTVFMGHTDWTLLLYSLKKQVLSLT